MQKNYATLTIVLVMLVNLMGTSMAPGPFEDAPVVADPPRVPPVRSLPLEADAASGERADPETYTDDAGRYRFAGLPHGTHKVTLDPDTLPPHLWPAPSPLSPPLGGTKGGEETVDVLWLTPGMEQVSEPLFTGVRFTAAYDRESGDISGVVFLDLDGDGRPGPDEPGLPGVRVIDPTVHQYFVPFDDRDLWTLFVEKDLCHVPTPDAPSQPLISRIFLTSGSNGTIYYYDHWEDGYDDDPLNPDFSGSTEVGVLDAGATQLFSSDILIAQLGIAPYYYDGRDRITIFGEEGTVVRLAYPFALGPYSGSLLAAAWEVPEAADWGTEYVATVGEDLDFNEAAVDDHDYAGLEVMAWKAGTQVYYNGFPITYTLGPGDTFFVDGENNEAGGGGVDSDDFITATAPVQVQMMTGACGGTAYSAHGYTLQPVDVWDDAYWAPVPGFASDCNLDPRGRNSDADIYLHNPHPVSITVTASSDFVDTFVITANHTVSVLDATGWSDISTGIQGVYFSSSHSFWGVGVIDSSMLGGPAHNYDWGYVLIPESDLSSQVIVGYAPGNPGALGDNGNVAFVTAVTDTVIYVDLNQDGLPDPFDMDGDGARNDTNRWEIDAWDEPLSALGVPLEVGQVLRVGDPTDHDLMGARIYTTDMEERIAAAWGQDPCRATFNEYADLGYTILPVPTPRLSKVDELADDADLTGDISPGDTINYIMVLHNNSMGSMNEVEFEDNLPYTYTDFVVGSLGVTIPPPTEAISYYDGIDWIGTPVTDAQKIRITWNTIGASEIVTITFRVRLHTNIPLTITEITNQGWVDAINADRVWSEDPDDPEDPDTDTPVGRPLLSIDKTVSPTLIRPGDRVTYTLVVENSGSGLAVNLAITDALPLEMTYVPGTLGLTWPVAQIEEVTRTVTHTARFSGYYADDFDLNATQTTYYTGNDGSLDWTSDWTESNDDPLGLPTGGEIQIFTSTGPFITPPACLTMTNTDVDDAGVSRMADLSAFDSPLLRYYVFGSVDDDTTDQYQVRANGADILTEWYTGTCTIREMSLVSIPITLDVWALSGMESDDYYRFDNFAIYESRPERQGTTTLSWKQTVLSYTTSTGGDPASYDPVSGHMVVTQGVRLPVGGVITATYQARADIPLPNGLTLTNLAAVTSTNWADVTAPPTDTAPVEIVSDHEITLTKSAWPVPAQAGALLTYTLRYTVTGDGIAPDVVISDTVPPSTTFHSCTPACTAVGGVVAWRLGSVTPITTDAVTMVVQVASPLISGTLLHNIATISDTDGVTTTGEITTPVESSHTLGILKTAQPSLVAPGGLLTYTIAYTVTGNEPAYDVTILEETPEHTIFQSCGPAPCTESSGVVIWELGDFLTYTMQATGAVTMVVQTSAGLTDGSIISNVATITDTSGTVTDTGELTTTVLGWHTLALTKTAQPSPVQAGGLLTYTIDWAVAGNEPALGVVISDVTPAYTTFYTATPPPADAPSVGDPGVVIWDLGDRSPGESGATTLVVQVATPLTDGLDIHNVATIGDGDGVTTTGVVTTPVESWHILEMSKVVTPTPVSPGGLLTYTIAYTVTGNEPVYDLTISDETPEYTTFYTATPPADSDPGVGGTGLVVWNLGDFLTAGTGITQETGTVIALVVRANIPLTDGLSIRNAATISDTEFITETDGVTTTVAGWHSLAITKTAQPSPVLPGELLTYTIDWAVTGDELAPNVTLSDATPTSTTFYTATQPTVAAPLVGDPGLVIWSLGDQIPPASGTVTMVVRVEPAVLSGTLLLNSAAITDTGGVTGTDQITTPVEARADLAVSKASEPDPVPVGTLLTYTLVVTNHGPSIATNVVLTDTLPPQVTLVGTTPPYSSTDPLAWTLGDVAPGEVRRVTVTVQVSLDVTQTFTNAVFVDSDTTDDDPDNDDDIEDTTPLVPGLEMVKSVVPDEAVGGEPFTYTIHVTNTGQLTLDPLALTDTLPSGFHYVAGSASPSAPDVVAEPTLAWQNLGPLTPGASLTVRFVVTAASGITGTYANMVLVEGKHPGGVITDTDDVPVFISDPAVVVDKRLVGQDTVGTPRYVTFTIVITNTGVSTLDRVPLRDLYDPSNISFVDSVPYPEEDDDDGDLAWHDLTGPAPYGFDRNLAPGESFIITTVFSVVNDAITVTTVNTAVVSGAEDVYGNQPEEVEDDELIVNVPTAVELLYFRLGDVGGRQVRLEWATAVEVDNFGFNLYRAGGQAFQPVVVGFVPSLARGGGATYTYVDTAPTADPWWYWLADVDTSGRETFHGPVSTVVEATAQPHRVYLPLVASGAGSKGAKSQGKKVSSAQSRIMHHAR
jgi:uncharacterized repeat protein (TIGR01451 family)